MTSQEIISASYGAEKSYTHNLDNMIDPSGAVGAWGTAKESTTELVDLSGNGNIADIHGAMPAEGFIQGRRFDGNDNNYLYLNENLPTRLVIAMCIESDDLTKTQFWLKNADSDSKNLFYLASDTAAITIGWRFDNSGADKRVTTSRSAVGLTSNSRKYVFFVLVDHITGENKLYVDGILKVDSTLNPFTIGDTESSYSIGSTSTSILGKVYYAMIHEIQTNYTSDQFFNTFARLPFWSVNYTDYPDNVTEYTDNLPYSSSIISSGTFKVDDDKLQCVSAGTITYSASYKFDGSEYIKVTIDGVEYAGTGTITQGNTTVSVAQDSNKVTIVMGTGDTIDDEINIQFREEV